MNMQSFMATALATTVGLAGIGAGALASFPRHPIQPDAQPASFASAAPDASGARTPGQAPADASGAANPAPAVAASAAPRRMVAQAAPHVHAARPRPRPARAEVEPRAARTSAQAEPPRQVVVLPPGSYPGYAGYYRPY